MTVDKIAKAVITTGLVIGLTSVGTVLYTDTKLEEFPIEYRSLVYAREVLEERLNDGYATFNARDVGEQTPRFRKSLDYWTGLVSKIQKTEKRLVELEENHQFDRELCETLRHYHVGGFFTGGLVSLFVLMGMGIYSLECWRDKKKEAKNNK